MYTHMFARLSQWALTACLAVAIAACSRDPETAATPPPATAVPAWLDDFELGPPGAAYAPVTAGRRNFEPGEAVELSMSVHHAPQGATVTAYWYGPQDEPLGYETKLVTPGQDQLTFTHDNTHDENAQSSAPPQIQASFSKPPALRLAS
jgi:hypothetical protein